MQRKTSRPALIMTARLRGFTTSRLRDSRSQAERRERREGKKREGEKRREKRKKKEKRIEHVTLLAREVGLGLLSSRSPELRGPLALFYLHLLVPPIPRCASQIRLHHTAHDPPHDASLFFPHSKHPRSRAAAHLSLTRKKSLVPPRARLRASQPSARSNLIRAHALALVA